MAKKKLSRDQKRKRKKRKRRQQSQPGSVQAGDDKLLQRLEESGVGDYHVVHSPEHAEKMSEVLMDFIEPYQDVVDTTETMRKLITTALVAWNTALLPEEEQADALKEISTAFPAEAVDDFYAIVGEMIERKKRYFADYNRYILDYELTDRGHDYYVSVVSTLMP